MNSKILIATIAIGALLALGSAAFASHTTLIVDDDKVQCPSAAYTTIQAAVDAANPSDTIKVCAGTYNESVTVGKTLTFRGAQHGRDATGRCDTAMDPTRDSIVDPPDTGGFEPGFNVNADNVVINGFTVTGATDDTGIQLARAFSGYRVSNNVIRENTFGVFFNSNGVNESHVRKNCFKDNNVTGSAAGNGIYSDQGLANAVMAENFFTAHTNAAMIFVGSAHRGLAIRHNEIVGDVAVILVNATDSVIRHNRNDDSPGSGIFFGGDVVGVEVRHNEITDCAFTGINLPLNLAYPVTGPNTNNVISHNTVRGCGDAGIRLRDGANLNRVHHNDVADNGSDDPEFLGYGISLEDADNNTVAHNTSDDNRTDGLKADVDSKDNLIEKNKMDGNDEHDCHDDSVGGGTAGTANTWNHNEGDTETPSGICEGDDDNGEVTATLYADGSISCSGADDLSDPDGSAKLTPKPGAVDFIVNLDDAEPNTTYTLAISKEASCSDAQFYPNAITTDGSGDGSFSGTYTTAPGSYNLLVNLVTTDPISDPKHREIGTQDATVIVP